MDRIHFALLLAGMLGALLAILALSWWWIAELTGLPLVDAGGVLFALFAAVGFARLVWRLVKS